MIEVLITFLVPALLVAAWCASRASARPRMQYALCLMAVMSVSMVAVACTFSGALSEKSPSSLPSSDRPAAFAPNADYCLMKLGRGGKRLSLLAPIGELDARLVEEVVTSYALKSELRPGTDIDSLDECFLIRITRLESEEVRDFYAYQQNGQSVLQMSKDGLCGFIDAELYASLQALLNGQYRDIDTSISQAILDHNAGTNGGEFRTESHLILKKVEHQRAATVYLMVFEAGYDFPDGSPKMVSGSHMPIALTFSKDKHGAYTPTEYWQPMDGTDYPSSIRNRFPADIAGQAMDTQPYVQQQRETCDQAARRYLLWLRSGLL